ncbi:hypothetical protein [Microbacterium sp. NPDC089696]|uniref:hypothetical protein n=1 Tax=Microbacterium sp. NPDC089696 TaxID=3364199 RepID=UPI0038050342
MTKNKTTTEAKTEKKGIDLNELLRLADEERKMKHPPVDVEVLLSGRIMTVRMPHLSANEFDEFTLPYCPHPAYRDQLGCWFELENVTRNHPGVVLVDGDVEDDLYVIGGTRREKEAVYRWGEIYDSLRHEDKQNLQAAVWGVYVHEAQKKMAAAKAAAAKAAK